MPCLVNCASIRHWSVLSLWLLTSIYTLPKYKIHHCMQTNELKIIVLDCVIADKSLSALRCVLILADVIFYCLLHWIKNTDLWIKDPGFLVIQHCAWQRYHEYAKQCLQQLQLCWSDFSYIEVQSLTNQ